MAIKTFANNEVLTASDTNTFLANAGLVYVKSQTVGSGITTVTVTNAFSADYDNYRIIYTGGTQSANGATFLQLAPNTVGQWNSNYNVVVLYSNTTASPQAAGNTNTVYFSWTGGGMANQATQTTCDLFSPFQNRYTQMRNGGYADNQNFGVSFGEHTSTNSFTGFTLGCTVGTLSGGVITVYGYRKA